MPGARAEFRLTTEVERDPESIRLFTDEARGHQQANGSPQTGTCATHCYHDGTAHVIFEPPGFIARLAILVPKPRVDLT